MECTSSGVRRPVPASGAPSIATAPAPITQLLVVVVVVVHSGVLVVVTVRLWQVQAACWVSSGLLSIWANGD